MLAHRLTTVRDELCVHLRECWARADNLRQSCPSPGGYWKDYPLLHAVVVEYISVAEEARRCGIAREFLGRLAAEAKCDIVIVEAVQNPHLAQALLRWGWVVDLDVMDFYWSRTDAAREVVSKIPKV